MSIVTLRDISSFRQSSLRDESDLTKFITEKNGKYSVVFPGGSASVYKCTYKPRNEKMDVAVKAVRVDHDREAFWRELGIWVRLCHDCIVPLLGTTTHYSTPGHVSIVSSWMPNGTLASYLNVLNKGHVKVLLPKKYNLLYNIADGLHYLHSQSVVHGDLTSSNVLINEKGQACLADFGLSSMMKPGSRFKYLCSNVKQPGAWPWSAPELINYEDEKMYVPSPSSDIYSYGCIIYEVLSSVAKPSLALGDILNGKTPNRPKSEYMQDEDWIFVLQCWLSLPSLRPLVSQALSFSRTRVSAFQDHAESQRKSKCTSTYSVHLDGGSICNFSSLVRPHPRPAFSDPDICWKSVDKLAEALLALFIGRRYRHGLEDAIQLYHVSLATFVPSFQCITSSLHKIATAILQITTEQSDLKVMSPIADMVAHLDQGNLSHLISLTHLNVHGEPDLNISSMIKSRYREAFSNATSDIQSRLQMALVCARVAENIDQATFSLEAYENSLQLLQLHISTAHITTWAEPVEHLSTSIAVDAAAAALRLGDVGKAVELLEWGKELLRTYIIHSRAICSEEDEKRSMEMSSHSMRPSFSSLLEATQNGPVVILIAGRRSCDAIIMSNTYFPQAPLHVPLKTISLDFLAELTTTFQSYISSALESTEPFEEKLEDVLRRLWVHVVKPVMDHLKNMPPDTRIWWCPTSHFSTLPIHAAGDYASKGTWLSQLCVPSYISSVALLQVLQAQRTCADHPVSKFAAIYVAKPLQNDEKREGECPAIKSAGLEADLVMSNLPASLSLRRFREAKKRDALKAFKDYRWFHLMAYASQNAAEPLNPSFLMSDGSLAISDIIEADAGPKEFAFLSPRPVGSRFSWMQDEVFQFAAGLQIYGFKSVVGMMGNVGDFNVIDKFYRALFRTEPPDCTRAAQALHGAVEDVANSSTEVSLRQRAAFAHIGL